MAPPSSVDRIDALGKVQKPRRAGNRSLRGGRRSNLSFEFVFCQSSLSDAPQAVDTAQSAELLTFPVPTISETPHKAAWSNPVRQDTANRRGATCKAEGQSMASGVDRMSRAVWHPERVGKGAF
jgi:hypothetical protein